MKQKVAVIGGGLSGLSAAFHLKEAGKEFAIDNMNFDDWSDEDIEDGKYSHLWDGLYDEDMDWFIKQFKIPEEMTQYPWHKLPIKVKENFNFDSLVCGIPNRYEFPILFIPFFIFFVF
jgi:flavin-dependent dehydrogenase